MPKRTRTVVANPVPCKHCNENFRPLVQNVKIGKGNFCSRRCARLDRPKRAMAERFWSKVDKSDADRCWIWTGGQQKRGYGTFKISAEGTKASKRSHRLAWEMENGEIPDGLFVCHKCDNPSCVRVSHLFLGTHAENMADCVAKGRKPGLVGEKHNLAKLTESQVKEIRARKEAGTTSQKDMALEYGVTQSAISEIILRKSWAHI